MLGAAGLAAQHVGDLDSQKKYEEVIAAAPAVIKLFPQYVVEANAYIPLSIAYSEMKDRKASAAVLIDYEKMGGSDPVFLKHLADLEVEQGTPTEAAAIETTIFI